MWYEKLIKIKKDSGKTTEEIQLLSGVPRGTLNKIFAGKTKDPQLETIQAILYALGCSLKDLENEDVKETSSKIVSLCTHLNEAGKVEIIKFAQYVLNQPQYTQNPARSPELEQEADEIAEIARMQFLEEKREEELASQGQNLDVGKETIKTNNTVELNKRKLA